MKVTDTHPEYDNNSAKWEFYIRSYLGGEEYKDGEYLTKYVNETKEEYQRRIALTPLDNHCRNIVHIIPHSYGVLHQCECLTHWRITQH